MKVSKAKMAEHREMIITSAAQRFREFGFDGISVADLMKEVGLTHGGFYGHFDSKEELVALASQRAMSDSAARWEKAVTEGDGEPLEALAKYYFARKHSGRNGMGCLFALLGSDLARQPATVRRAVTDGLEQFLDVLGRVIPGRTKEARRRKAIATYATMIGGMILARGVEDEALSDEILQVVSASIAPGLKMPA